MSSFVAQCGWRLGIIGCINIRKKVEKIAVKKSCCKGPIDGDIIVDKMMREEVICV